MPQEAPKDTMADLLPEFLERWVKKRNRSWKESERTINRDILPHWQQRRIGEIKRADVIKLLDDIVERGAAIQANRVFALLRKFFNWCIERGLIEASPITRMKPPSPENERDRWLNDTELRDLWWACDVIGWPFGPLVKLLILTGQRRDEVASLHWADINVADKLWTIPKERAKNGRAHQVPLSPAALDIIEALPRMPDGKSGDGKEPEKAGRSPLVFTTTGKTAVSGFSKIKTRLDELMAAAEAKRAAEEGREPIPMPEWVLHDLRRTITTHASESLGIAPHVADKILNHVGGTIRGVAAVYNRAEYLDERRHALNAWAQKVMGLMEPLPGNVVPMKGR